MVDKGSEFYIRSIKSFLQNNDIEMYLTHNEKKSVVAERFIRTLKKKMYKYATFVSKNVYIDKLDDTVNKYNNTYHSKIKLQPVDVKSSIYIYDGKEINNKDPKFKIVDIIRISKCKNIFAKVYTPTSSEEVFWSFVLFCDLKVKNTVPWVYVINDLNGEEIFATYCKK